jgi:hypothetical protein
MHPAMCFTISHLDGQAELNGGTMYLMQLQRGAQF